MKRHLSFSSVLLLLAALSFWATATFADVKDWADGDETRGREVCGVISKFWNVSHAKAAKDETARHYELLTDEVLANGIDWSKAMEVAEGIHVIYYKAEPGEQYPSQFRAGKKQKFYLARVDISQPGVRLTGPGRCNHWNELMIDTTSQGYRCATLREKSADLLARCRGDRADGGRAKDMRLAFNACAWGPWSDGKDQSSAFAQVNWPLMFDGIRVDRNVADGSWGAGSYNSGTPYNLFVFYKDGTAGFLQKLTEKASKDVWACIPNFGSILVADGVVTATGGQGDAQRTNIGLSQDKRYFYVSVSDGRDAEWASGPDYYECGLVQKAMGAYGAIALDGGGSSTLMTWDEENAQRVMHNWQSGTRRNGSNCGVYFYSVLKQDDSDYRDIDDYVGYGLAAGDVATIVRDSVLTVTNGFPASCTVKGQRPGVTFGWGRKVSPTVLAGTRVCFTNIAFAADSRTLTVKAGGTAAVASDVLDKVVTADASGFELAGALTADLTVDCAAADADGDAFGTTSVAAPDTATLLHLRHPSNPGLCAAASGGQLVWRRYVTYSSVVVTPGYDFTNAVVTATVSDFADHVDGSYALRLTITDRHNHTAVLSKPVSGPGAYVFDTAEAESQEYFSGYGFDFTLELVDGDGNVVADEVTVTGALNFANKTSWFAASAANDSETNGAWDAKPLIEGGLYMIGEEDKASFLATAERGGDVIIGTTATFFGAFDRTELDSRLADYAALSPLGVLTICEDPETGANVWCGLVRGGDGQPAWKYLQGRPATPTVSYRIAEEIDFSGGAPYVSYLVAAPGDAEPFRLRDADGTVWFDGIGTQTQAAGKLLYDGEITVADIEGEHLDKSVAEVDGTRYATFGEAAAAGGSVTLLTNVSWTPDTDGTWQITDGGFDLRLHPSDLTAEYRDGRLVVSGGIVVPSRFPVNGSATVTAIVSSEFIQKHFPGSDVSTQAGFDAVLAGLNAKRTEGNGLTLLESYILGLDPDDATAVPQATIAYDAAGGRFVIALGDQVKVNEAADVGVKYALRAADDVSFTDAVETEPGTERTFTFEPNDAAKKFFTIRISFSENEQK